MTNDELSQLAQYGMSGLTPEKAQPMEPTAKLPAPFDPLVGEYPSMAKGIGNARRKGYSDGEIRSELAKREAMYSAYYNPQELDAAFGRTGKSKAELYSELKGKQYNAFVKTLDGKFSEKAIRDVLHTASLSSVSPSLLFNNPEFIPYAEKAAGERLDTMGEIYAATGNAVANWLSSNAAEHSLGSYEARRSADAVAGGKKLTPEQRDKVERETFGVRGMSIGQQVKQIQSDHNGEAYNPLELALRKRAENLKNLAEGENRYAEKMYTHYRRPDSQVGAFFLDVIENSGMTVASSVRSAAAWTTGAMAGGPVGSWLAGMAMSGYNTYDESRKEAGQAFLEALSRGMSEDDAYKAAMEVQRNNILLLSATNFGGDILTFGLGGTATKIAQRSLAAGNTSLAAKAMNASRIIDGGAASILERVAAKIPGSGKLAAGARFAVAKGIPYIGASLPEGIEEAGQYIITNLALGDEIDRGELWDAAKMGIGMGLVYAGTGHVASKALDVSGKLLGKLAQKVDPESRNGALVTEALELQRKISSGEISATDEIRLGVTAGEELVLRMEKAKLIAEDKLNADTPEAERARFYRDQLCEEVITAGRPQDEAESYAAVRGYYLLTSSERFGVNVDELYQAQIKRSEQAWEAHAAQGDSNVENVDGKKEPRAGVFFDRVNHDATIELFKTSDASSLGHELWHTSLEDMIDFGGLESANAEAKADRSGILEWLGIDDLDLANRGSFAKDSVEAARYRAAQEKWADHGEAYYQTGKAPTPQLEGAFARLKKWLLDIYNGVKGQIELSDEVRGYFDRMLATPEEINAAYEARTQVGELLNEHKAVKERIGELEREIGEGNVPLDADAIIERIDNGELKPEAIPASTRTLLANKTSEQVYDLAREQLKTLSGKEFIGVDGRQIYFAPAESENWESYLHHLLFGLENFSAAIEDANRRRAQALWLVEQTIANPDIVLDLDGDAMSYLKVYSDEKSMTHKLVLEVDARGRVRAVTSMIARDKGSSSKRALSFLKGQIKKATKVIYSVFETGRLSQRRGFPADQLASQEGAPLHQPGEQSIAPGADTFNQEGRVSPSEVLKAIMEDPSLLLNVDKLAEQYGDSFLDTLPRGIESIDGAMTADELASMFGYENGAELLQNLTDASIQREERMIGEWDDILIADELAKAEQENPAARPNVIEFLRENGKLDYQSIKDRFGAEDAKALHKRLGPGMFSKDGLALDDAAGLLSHEGIRFESGDALLDVLLYGEDPKASPLDAIRRESIEEGKAIVQEKLNVLRESKNVRIAEVEKKARTDERSKATVRKERQAVAYEIKIEDIKNQLLGAFDDMRIQRNVAERIGKIEKADAVAKTKEQERARGEKLMFDERVRHERHAVRYEVRLERQGEHYESKIARLKELQAKRKQLGKLKQEIAKMLKEIRRAERDKKVAWAKHEEILECMEPYDLKRRPQDQEAMLQDFEIYAAFNPEEAGELNPNDTAFFNKLPLSSMSIAEVRGLNEEVKRLQAEGVELEEMRLAERQERIDRIFERLAAPLYKKWEKRQRRDRDGNVIPGAIGDKEDLKKQYKGLFKIVEKGVDWAYAATLGTQRLCDWIDDGKGRFNGAFVELFCDRVNQCRDAELRETFRRREQMEEGLKKLGFSISDFGKEVDIEGVKHKSGRNFTIDECMSIYAGMKNEKSRDAILFGVFKEYGDRAQAVVDMINGKLSDAEKTAVDLVMRDYGAEFDRLNQAFIDAYNEGMEQEENYTPMRRLEYTTSEGLLDAETGQQLMDAKSNAGGLGKVEAGFLVSRIDIDEKGQKGIDLGLFEIWLGQVERQEHAAAFAELLSDMKSIMTSQRYGLDSGMSLRKLVSEIHGDGAWKALTEYYNVVTRNDTAIASDVLKSSSQWFARSMSTAYLCGNLGTVLKQTTSYPRLLAFAGPTHLLSAIGQFANNPKAFMKSVFEMDPQLRDRHGNLMMRALQEGGGLEGAWGKAIQLGMEPIMLMDQMTAAIGWKAVYDANIDRKLSIAEATREAQRAVLLTQQATHAKDAPRIWQQKGYVKLAMIFTSEAAQLWGMTTYDMVQAIRRGEIPQILSTLAAVTVTAMMFKLMVDGPPDDEDDETWLKWCASAVGRQTVEAMPLVGKELMTMFDAKFGKKYTGTQYSAFVAPIAKLFDGVDEITDDDPDNNEKAIWSFIESVSLLGVPFPATGAKRLWDSGRMLKNGEPGAALLNELGMRRWIKQQHR